MTRAELLARYPNASAAFLRLNSQDERFCEQCGKPYTDSPSRRLRFCSLECAYKNEDRGKRISKRNTKDRGVATCQNCLSTFKLKTNGGVSFCSRRCASSFTGRQTMAKNRRQKPCKHIVEKLCDTCSKPFKAPQSNQRKYCSTKCSAVKTGQKISASLHASGFYKSAKPYSRGKACWVEIDGKRFFARSRWEANYGLFLEFQKSKGLIKDWWHEPETFWFDGIKRGVCSYLPDFKVCTLSGSFEYHEVKGWMDDRSKTKIRRMAKYHPAVMLIVKDAAWFKANRGLAKTVPGWLL